ncbi:MAG: hypothetical protein A2033_08220 [Bacteroidetes bacterium GWA2_31_9]|nr:MAG: hypothetical protein A2033_08220 [Bacteroidetes bacterium GWA2_31_9]
MKIAILGTRGIPNNYGGFEEFAENLALQLVLRNHNVTVYCPESHPYNSTTFNKINLIKINSLEWLGVFSQLIYDYKCMSDATKKNFDVVLMCGYSSSPFYYLFKNKFKLLTTNLDGIEWKRSKWNFLIKKYLQIAEKIAVKKSHISVADNIEIQKYFEKKYKIKPSYIPYGAAIFTNPNKAVINKLNLESNNYFLIISRLEPENSIKEILESYIKSKSKKKLVIISNFNANYFGKKIHSEYKHNSQIIFTSDIYDKTILNNLRYFSYAYIHGHTVGGTNPSLLEAMACNCKIIAHNNNYNKAILGDDALYFDNLSQLSQLFISDDLKKINTFNNINKINELYNWKQICDEYEILLKN